MKITTVIGPVCSGKTHLINAEYQQAVRVDVGDIVREVTKENSRVFDEGLDGYITTRLSGEINEAFANKWDVVIGGIRQLSILIYVEKHIKRMTQLSLATIQYERIYLNVDEQIRRERYLKRGATKDHTYTFSEVERRDNALGLRQLTSYCLEANKSKTIIKK